MTETNTTKTNGQAYATADQALSWKSPEPLALDHVHSDTQQTFRIEGICKAKDRKAIHEAIRRMKPSAVSLKPVLGYEPTESDITDACWCAACVTAPKMSDLQWLQFGAEASLGEVTIKCLIASRIIEDKDPDTKEVITPDGEAAAEAELTEDPS